MMDQEHSQSGIVRAETLAKRWNVVSIGAFVAAGTFGLIRTLNDIRHQFYQAFVIGYKGRRTIFSDVLDRSNIDFQNNSERFNSGAIDVKTYANNQAAIAESRNLAVRGLMHERMHIANTNPIADWTLGTYQRFHLLGRTNRVNAAMGFASTAAVAMGAVAVLKHGSHLLDAINEKLETREPQSRG